MMPVTKMRRPLEGHATCGGEWSVTTAAELEGRADVMVWTAHYFSEMPFDHGTFASWLIVPVGSPSPEWLTGTKNFRSDCCCGRARQRVFHLIHLGPAAAR